MFLRSDSGKPIIFDSLYFIIFIDHACSIAHL